MYGNFGCSSCQINKSTSMYMYTYVGQQHNQINSAVESLYEDTPEMRLSLLIRQNTI